MTHTPGPWRYDSVSKCVKLTGSGHVVVDITAGKLAVDLGNHVDCDGRLIAAAPEMLDWLKEKANHGSGCLLSIDWRSISLRTEPPTCECGLTALIAKAERKVP